jgi:anti-anti-sigma regulatory factor
MRDRQVGLPAFKIQRQGNLISLTGCVTGIAAGKLRQLVVKYLAEEKEQRLLVVSLVQVTHLDLWGAAALHFAARCLFARNGEVRVVITSGQRKWWARLRMEGIISAHSTVEEALATEWTPPQESREV